MSSLSGQSRLQLAIDSKLRLCGLARLRVSNVYVAAKPGGRTTVTSRRLVGWPSLKTPNNPRTAIWKR
jgi:hypothetical protein